VIAASRLFMIMGAFGFIAGGTYWAWNYSHPEAAGVVLLMAFFGACFFIGLMLWSVSAANKRRIAVPDTGLPGSANPARGARDEHGNMHVIPPTIAPAVYSLALTVILLALGFRHHLKTFTLVGVGLGVLLFLTATAIWYRATSADARAKIRGHDGLAEHATAVAATAQEPVGPPGPANYFEQVREALEAGDADWAATAYDRDAVYYESANPPHEGREDIRTYLTDLLKGHRNLQYTVERMGVDGDSAIVEWTWSFRTRDNRRVTGQAGASVIQVGPNGIVYHRDYL
jgi:uncharacterized protein (TIGR02246 family)